MPKKQQHLKKVVPNRHQISAALRRSGACQKVCPSMLNCRKHLNCGQQSEQLQTVSSRESIASQPNIVLVHRLRTPMNDIHDVFNKRDYDTTGLRLWPSCFEGTSAPFPQTNAALMVHRSSFVANCIKVRSSAWRFVYLATIRIATQPLDPWYVCHLTSTSATINDINNDQRRLSAFGIGLRRHLDDISSLRIWNYCFDQR